MNRAGDEFFLYILFPCDLSEKPFLLGIFQFSTFSMKWPVKSVKSFKHFLEEFMLI